MTVLNERKDLNHVSGPLDRSSDAPFSRVEARVFVIAFILTIAARGVALFPLSYSIDTYIEVLSPSYHADQYMQRLSQGRFGQAILNEALTALGASTPLTNTFYALLCMVCFVWVGLIVCRIWKVSDNPVLSLLVTAFLGLHPYQAELFTFNTTPVYTAGALLFSFTALYFSRGTAWSVVWTGLCFTLALSLYQTCLHFVSVSLAFAVILELTRQRTGGGAGPWRRIAEQTRLVPRLATLSSGLIAYLVVNKAVQYLLDVTPATRSQFLPPSEFPRRLIEARDAVVRMFAQSEPLIPLSVKVVLAFIGLIALFLGFRSCMSSGFRRGTRLSLGLLLALFFSVSAVSIIGVSLVIKEWWPVPRILSAMSFFQAGLVALAFSNAGPKLRIMVAAMAFVVLFAFIGINNHIFTDQLRVNLRDVHKASRIVDRMEDDPRFAQIQRVAMIGGNYAFRSPIYTAHGDLNISAFIASWAKVQILNEVSGYSFGEASPEEQILAAQHCEKSPKWPAPGSLEVSGPLAIVCQ